LQAAVVDDLYTLLSAYEMKVPTADSVKLDDLHEAVSAYQDGLSAAESFIEERKNGMMTDLEQQIGLLSEEALTLLGTLHGARFVDPEGDAAEIVGDLEASRGALGAARAKAETFQAYQKLFLMTVDDFGNLKETEKECNGR
jgi:dynein heavy chain